VNASRLLRVAVFILAAAPGVALALDLASGVLATPYRTILRETGLWSMRLLVLGLLLSPLARLSGSALLAAPRRMVGLFAAAYAFAHGWAWCRQHGYDWGFLLGELPRAYLLAGLAALLLLVPLVATSSALARARLGAAWARLHRLAIPVAILAAIHFLLSRALPPRESLVHAALLALALAERGVVAWREKTCPRGRDGGTPLR
jgi:sulfoxide reductase heme-binding subunit YedZ